MTGVLSRIRRKQGFDLERALQIVTHPIHDTFHEGSRISVKEVMNRLRALKHTGFDLGYRGNLNPVELVNFYFATCKKVTHEVREMNPDFFHRYMSRLAEKRAKMGLISGYF